MGDRYRAGDRVLYGGSMSPKDVDDLATQQDVDDGQSIERRWTGSGQRRWRRPPTGRYRSNSQIQVWISGAGRLR
ncbi:hypothetical protein IU20_11205 [Mycobacterium tuberculosis]|nr:hypothetical protein [Mycobacterium tuberculosis]AIH92577.1 hypothetical protein IU20_11205 [Mycobacterium tuberculosis]AIH96336.1 hypothetical protein IU23_11205 [Mycobacterium tuberculosis]